MAWDYHSPQHFMTWHDTPRARKLSTLYFYMPYPHSQLSSPRGPVFRSSFHTTHVSLNLFIIPEVVLLISHWTTETIIYLVRVGCELFTAIMAMKHGTLTASVYSVIKTLATSLRETPSNEWTQRYQDSTYFAIMNEDRCSLQRVRLHETIMTHRNSNHCHLLLVEATLRRTVLLRKAVTSKHWQRFCRASQDDYWFITFGDKTLTLYSTINVIYVHSLAHVLCRKNMYASIIPMLPT